MVSLSTALLVCSGISSQWSRYMGHLDEGAAFRCESPEGEEVSAMI